MRSLDEFHSFVNTLEQTKGELLGELKKNQRHLAIFEQEFEAATLLGDQGRINKAEAGLAIVRPRLAEVEAQIGGLDCLPELARNVFTEAEQTIAALAGKVEERRNAALAAKALYLGALKDLGELRRQSQAAADCTKQVCSILRLNPLSPLRLHGFRDYEVTLAEIQRLLD